MVTHEFFSVWRENFEIYLSGKVHDFVKELFRPIYRNTVARPEWLNGGYKKSLTTYHSSGREFMVIMYICRVIRSIVQYRIFAGV